MSRQAGLRAGLALVSLLLAALGGCATAPPDRTAELKALQARAAYERAVANIRDKQTGLAFAALQEAISLDDSVALYWNTQGWLYLQLGRLDEALPRFRKAVELDMGYAEAHLNLGVALAEAGQWEEAVAAYRQAIALPTLGTPHIAHQNLGLALYHLRRYREAEDALQLAIGLDPKLAAAYYHLGLVYTAEDRGDVARAAFRRARDLSPQSPFGQAAAEHLKALGEGG